MYFTEAFKLLSQQQNFFFVFLVIELPRWKLKQRLKCLKVNRTYNLLNYTQIHLRIQIKVTKTLCNYQTKISKINVRKVIVKWQKKKFFFYLSSFVNPLNDFFVLFLTDDVGRPSKICKKIPKKLFDYDKFKFNIEMKFEVWSKLFLKFK